MKVTSPGASGGTGTYLDSGQQGTAGHCVAEHREAGMPPNRSAPTRSGDLRKFARHRCRVTLAEPGAVAARHLDEVSVSPTKTGRDAPTRLEPGPGAASAKGLRPLLFAGERAALGNKRTAAPFDVKPTVEQPWHPGKSAASGHSSVRSIFPAPRRSSVDAGRSKLYTTSYPAGAQWPTFSFEDQQVSRVLGSNPVGVAIP